MYYHLLEGNRGEVPEIEESIRFDTLDDAYAHPMTKEVGIIIYSSEEMLSKQTVYPYHLAEYWTRECGWVRWTEEEAYRRAHSGFDSLWRCEDV